MASYRRRVALSTLAAVSMFVIALIIGGGVTGMIFGAYVSTITTTTATSQSNVVNLQIVPDFGGSTYDAYVLTSSLQTGQVPAPATNSTAPGVNDNNFTVPSGVTVTFVITTIDTAVNENYSGQVATPFTVYNDTNSGVIPSQYAQGQTVSMMGVPHTFGIPALGVFVPIPPDTIVRFVLTFSTPGTYLYECIAPCGSGMGLLGYMEGYVTVK